MVNSRTAHLIARLNGDITPNDVGKMDGGDYMECSRRWRVFGISAAQVRRLIGDIGVVFHWQPSEIGKMTIDELLDYHRQAVERSKPPKR